MKRNTFITMILLGISVVGGAFAQNVRQILNVPIYYAATCAQLTGTWLGSYTDPQGLLVDRAISVTLQAKVGRVIGTVKPLEATGVSSVNGRLWAMCDQGMLNHIFVGSSGQCGHFSSSGGLISANTILLYLPYENAMTGTNVLAVLHRESKQYTGRGWSIDTPAIHTCH